MIFVIYILIIFVIILAIILWLINKVLYCPIKKIVYKPKIKYDNIYISTETEKVYHHQPCGEYINMWHFSQFKKGNVMLFFHGNTGNISHRDYVIEICKYFKFNLLLIDYRGYGKSNGIPSICNICQDATIAYRYLRKHYSSEKIIIWGESLGGAPAIYIASKYPCHSLLLLSTFSSQDDLLDKYNKSSCLGKIVSGLIKLCNADIPTKKWIKNVKCRTIIIHSKEDDIISYKNGQILFNSIKHTNKLFITITGKHSSPIITDKQLKLILQFIGITHIKEKDLFRIIKYFKTAADRYKKNNDLCI